MGYSGFIDYNCKADIVVSVSLNENLDKDGLESKGKELAENLAKKIEEKYGNEKESLEVSAKLEDLLEEDVEEKVVGITVDIGYIEQVGFTEGAKSNDWYQPDDPDEFDEPDFIDEMQDMITESLKEMNFSDNDIDICDWTSKGDTMDNVYDKVAANKEEEKYARYERD